MRIQRYVHSSGRFGGDTVFVEVNDSGVFAVSKTGEPIFMSDKFTLTMQEYVRQGDWVKSYDNKATLTYAEIVADKSLVGKVFKSVSIENCRFVVITDGMLYVATIGSDIRMASDIVTPEHEFILMNENFSLVIKQKV